MVVGIDPDLSHICSLYPDWVKSIYPLINTSKSSKDSDYFKSITTLYLEYSKFIIDAVHDLVPAVKPQSAFFEVWGHQGIMVLEEVIAYARKRGLLIITDVKRGDVPSTAKHYATAYLDKDSPLFSDAITVNPYLGRDSLQPFIHHSQPPISGGIFILLKTSNSGSGDIQDLNVGEGKLYEYLARLIGREIQVNAEGYSNIGVVMGATYPESAKHLRRLLPHSFFLVPGLGIQGGDITQIRAYLNSDGKGALFNFSRSIIFPPSAKNDKKGQNIIQDIRKATLKCLKKVEENLPKNKKK